MKKDLVYYVVGGNDPGYVALLRYSLNTLRCSLENSAYDILVMCDPGYAPLLAHLPVSVHLTSKNDTPVQASMRKTEIFQYPRIWDYDKVLYLDCDTVITASLKPIFDSMTRENVLYGVPDRHTMHHEDRYYQCRDTPYDRETLDAFTSRGILPFNAGQYGFVVSRSMEGHFNQVAGRTSSYNPALHFYEQAFMNDHFNRRYLVDYAIETYFNICASTQPDTRALVNHFCNAGIPYMQKLEKMKDLHAASRCSLLYDGDLLLVDSRENIADAVTVPPRPCIVEIGTFAGVYAQVLLKAFEPVGQLHLIDPWVGKVASGDQDGNDVVWQHGEVLFEKVKALFEHHPCVHIHRAVSSNVVIKDASVDVIYIDGDHSYEGVAKDLALAAECVKYGGWICGHDYEMNHDKTRNHYDFGVKRAVKEFCRDHGLRVWALLNDGCVSFVIRR